MREQGFLKPGEERAAEAPNSSPWYLQGGQQGDGARSFTVVCGFRLKKEEVQSGYKEKKNHCEDNHSLEVFKTRPDKALATWSEVCVSPCLGQEVG